jgi:hypothetical protein
MIDRKPARGHGVEDADALEGRKEIFELVRLMDLRDLRGAEFLRLLRLAHAEGLLTELLQAAGCLVVQEGCSRPMSEELMAQAVPQIRSIR